MIKRLNKSCPDGDLFSMPLKEAKASIKGLMYSELSDFWGHEYDSSLYFMINPTWKSRTIAPFILNRTSTMLYHQLALNRGPLRAWRKDHGFCSDDMCRFCNMERETLAHVMINCPCLDKKRKSLVKSIMKRGMQLTLQNLFGEAATQRDVERFLLRIFTKDDLDDK